MEKKLVISIAAILTFSYGASAQDADYGTSVRRGSSVGSTSGEDVSYGTSVRKSRSQSLPQAPAMPSISAVPAGPLGFIDDGLPRDYIIDVPVVQQAQLDDDMEDISYGTSVRPGSVSSRQKRAAQTISYVRYTVRHVAHKAAGGYHVYYMSSSLSGYHLYYVAPNKKQTYMGWYVSK